MRFALQCLGAALASLAFPVAGALWVLASDPVVNADGSIDDAPERAAMLFLMASPVFLTCLALFFAAIASALRFTGKLSLGALLLVCVLVALAVAASFAQQGYTAFGLQDALISFASFGILTFITLGLGCACWWLLRPATTGRA